MKKTKPREKKTHNKKRTSSWFQIQKIERRYKQKRVGNKDTYKCVILKDVGISQRLGKNSQPTRDTLHDIVCLDGLLDWKIG